MSLTDLFQHIISLEVTLKCKFCNKLLEDPHLIKTCGHTLCKDCFTKEDRKCPICKASFGTSCVEDKPLKDMIAHLTELKLLVSEHMNGDSVAENCEELKEKTPNSTISTGNACDTTSKPCQSSATKRPKKRTVLQSASDEDEEIIQETPNDRKYKTPTVFPTRKAKLSVNKRLSSSTSSPGTPLRSTASPAGNINKKNHKGETPLHCAVIKGDISKVNDLLNKGASVNTQDNNGWTPLHEACNHGFIEIAQLLLDQGALVNVPSFKDNITPLHDALLNYKLEIAKLLVSRGGDLHAKASFGYTALDLCKAEEDREILIEACSPFIAANTIIPDSGVKAENSNKIVILYSNLDESQKAKLQKCAQILKASIVEDFKPEVTHIVTSCDNLGNCTRTMKVLLGMLSGKWLMNYEWIEVCLEYKTKVEEEAFEVQGTKNQPSTHGPNRARNNYKQKFPPLFDGFYFYLHGSFTKPTPLREELSNLIHLGGGKLLSREPKPDTVAAETHMIPYHAAGTPLENTSHVILFQDKPPRDTHVNSGHICTTQVMWLICCISEFSLLVPKQTNIK